MIVKRNFSAVKIWQYIKRPMWFIILWSALAWFIPFLLEMEGFYINFTPIGVLGSALAIFIAFRNNSSYGRWWEARQIWAGVVASSRVLARLIITFADSHSHQENYNKERSEAFKEEMVLRCIAWVNALRFHLRQQDNWEALKPLLPETDFDALVQSQNKPTFLHLKMGQEIYKAMAHGTLGGFDSFQMEGQLLALTNYQSAAEKIKQTPLPRQYDFFTRLFVLIFAALLPFGTMGFFQSDLLASLSWLSIPLSILISGVFVVMERTGAANEDPFENKITDIPMTALCNQVERDLKDMLVMELPAQILPQKGYLF